MNWRELTKTPPSWRALRAFNVAALIFCGGLALIQDNWWIMMFDAFAAGTAASSIYHTTKMIRVMQLFDQTREAFESMANINRALVEGQVEVTVRRLITGDDDAPIAPNKLN